MNTTSKLYKSGKTLKNARVYEERLICMRQVCFELEKFYPDYDNTWNENDDDPNIYTFPNGRKVNKCVINSFVFKCYIRDNIIGLVGSKVLFNTFQELTATQLCNAYDAFCKLHGVDNSGNFDRSLLIDLNNKCVLRETIKEREREDAEKRKRLDKIRNGNMSALLDEPSEITYNDYVDIFCGGPYKGNGYPYSSDDDYEYEREQERKRWIE
jgi:hypothetical protein